MSNSKIDSAAVISPCQMFHIGVRALLDAHSIRLDWHTTSLADAESSLIHHPVSMLIISLHVKLVDLSQVLQFIQRVQFSHPELRLITILDEAIPYLITRLSHLGVTNIQRLGQSLPEWERHLHGLAETERYPLCSERNLLPGGSNQALSAREYLVMSLLMQGLVVDEIAAVLMRSNKTVVSHKWKAMHKLGIAHYAQLITVQSLIRDSWISQDNLS